MNVPLNDSFSFLNEIDVCNYAHDSTPFACHKNLAELLEKLERNSELATNWFEYNHTVPLTISYHLFRYMIG